MVTIGQHIYGRSQDKGFSTLSCPPGITAEELRHIETKSNYELPASLYHDEAAEKPAKYIYYRLNDDKVVVGRGTYIGKDEHGRAGNYIFHNIILAATDMVSYKISPVRLIEHFVQTNTFITDAIKKEIRSEIGLDLQRDWSGTEDTGFAKLMRDYESFYAEYLYLSFQSKSIDAPIIVLYSEEGQLFDFLQCLFFALPRRIWNRQSFNSLWYQDSVFLIRGIKKGFPLPSTDYVLKIDLGAGTYESKIESRDAILYEFAKFAAQKALNNESGLQELYSIQDLAEEADWGRFIELYRKSKEDIQRTILSLYRVKIINEILHGNIALYDLAKSNMSSNEREQLFQTKDIVNRLIKNGGEADMKDIVDWFYMQPENKGDYYSKFLHNPALFDLLLGKMKDSRFNKDKNVGILRGFLNELLKIYKEREIIDVAAEYKLMMKLSEVLNDSEINNVSDIIKLLKKLPPTNDIRDSLQRVLLIYKLGDRSALFSAIKEEKYQVLIYELLNEAIKKANWERYRKLIQNKEQKSSFFGR